MPVLLLDILWQLPKKFLSGHITYIDFVKTGILTWACQFLLAKKQRRLKPDMILKCKYTLRIS